MDIKIKEVTIQLGKRELKLSLDEARQLRKELENLFSAPIQVAPWVYDKYVWYPSYPRDPWIVYGSCDNATTLNNTSTKISWEAA